MDSNDRIDETTKQKTMTSAKREQTTAIALAPFSNAAIRRAPSVARGSAAMAGRTGSLSWMRRRVGVWRQPSAPLVSSQLHADDATV